MQESILIKARSNRAVAVTAIGGTDNRTSRRLRRMGGIGALVARAPIFRTVDLMGTISKVIKLRH